MADYADGLVLGVAEVGAVDGNGLALNFVGPAGVVAIAGDGERKVGGLGDVIGLAVVEGFELRELIGVLFDEVGELVHEIAALGGGHFSPGAFFESGASGADGFVDVGASASATWVMTSPVAGLMVGNVLPDVLLTHWPLMSSLVALILTLGSIAVVAVAMKEAS